MLNYPIFIINETQVKINSWSKDGHNAHFWTPYIKLKLNIHLKRDINIIVIFNV